MSAYILQYTLYSICLACVLLNTYLTFIFLDALNVKRKVAKMNDSNPTVDLHAQLAISTHNLPTILIDTACENRHECCHLGGDVIFALLIKIVHSK